MSNNTTTIAQKLARVKSAAYNIKTSIVGKGQIPSGGLETYPAAIDAIQGGGSTERTNWDVVFIDYDGTILDRYELPEGGTITYPQTPVHADKGIVFDCWNTAGDTANVATYGPPEGVFDMQKRIIIGAVYSLAESTEEPEVKTYPSVTTLVVDIPSLSYATIGLRLTSTVADGTTIDWGDETTTTTTATGNTNYTHTYQTRGRYEIVISCANDCKVGFYGSGSNNTSINGNAKKKAGKITIGTNCNNIGAYAFYQCNFKSIDIPGSVASIGNYAFGTCPSLRSVALQAGVTTIGDYAFNACYSLKSVILPDTITTIGVCAFRYCYSLNSIRLPRNLPLISGNTFEQCYSVSYIVIPDSVTTIGSNAFN